MTDLIAVYKVNKYILGANRFASLMNYTAGAPISPIYSIQDGPDVEDTTNPYITYRVSMLGTNGMYMMNTDEVIYSVQGTDVDVLRTISKEFYNVFDRADLTALDVNDWLGENGDDGEFDFKTFSITSATDPLPTNEDRPSYIMPVIMRYSYTSDSGLTYPARW